MPSLVTLSIDGIITSDGKEHELDVLIYATGFDAITGAFSSIDWTGASRHAQVCTGPVINPNCLLPFLCIAGAEEGSTVTKDGIITSDGKEHELDVLIYATGFDAITGAFSSRTC
jgi:cation diffusion facilitator CzcD-associated flavoprotein CzcO